MAIFDALLFAPGPAIDAFLALVWNLFVITMKTIATVIVFCIGIVPGQLLYERLINKIWHSSLFEFIWGL